MNARVWLSVVVGGVAIVASSNLVAGPRVPAAPPTGVAAPIDKAEHAARRAKLMAQIGDGAAVILGASTPASDVAFRQNHDFFYLTGVEIPDAMLIIDGARKESVLFFTMDAKSADGLGIPVALVTSPVEETGIERVMAAEQFGAHLAGIVNRRQPQPIYTMFKPEEIGPENSNEKFNALQRSMTMNPWDGRLTRELQFVRQLRERFPQADVRDVSPIVWDMRKYKSPAELAILRETARIGVEGHKALIRSTQPGVTEHALSAVFDFVTALNGARGLAYYTIIMSGKNHEYGHYHAYDRTLADGDFLILDAGPAYRNYHVDISTTFPASGRFSARQRELYEAALVIRNAAIDDYRPGITLRDVGTKMQEALTANGLERFADDFASIIRYGGYNHSVGLATHDVMGTFAGPDEVLQPGFVFACDIQLYRIDEEIGIRIEDTVAITDTGSEVLSHGLPRTVAEIEALMQEKGVLQTIEPPPVDAPAPLGAEVADLLARVKAAGLESSRNLITVYYPAEHEAGALRLRSLVEDAMAYYDRSLGLRGELHLAVLTRAQWEKLITWQPYGIPGVAGEPPVAFLPATDDGLAATDAIGIRAGVSPETVKIIEAAGGTYDEAARRYVDLVGLHELGHAYTRRFGIRVPSPWAGEMLATYFAYAFLREHDPRRADVWDGILRAYRDAVRPTHTTLADFDRLYFGVGAQNYIWYQARFQQMVRAAYEAQGLDFLHAVREAFPEGEGPVSAGETLRRFEAIFPGFSAWAELMRD